MLKSATHGENVMENLLWYEINISPKLSTTTFLFHQTNYRWFWQFRCFQSCSFLRFLHWYGETENGWRWSQLTLDIATTLAPFIFWAEYSPCPKDGWSSDFYFFILTLNFFCLSNFLFLSPLSSWSVQYEVKE